MVDMYGVRTSMAMKLLKVGDLDLHLQGHLGTYRSNLVHFEFVNVISLEGMRQIGLNFYQRCV